MASEINVDKIIPQSGTTLELGDSGDTITVTGTLDGSGLTGLNADNLTSGTVPDARFPAALPAIDGSALTGIETGTDWQSTIVTGATLTAVAGKGYWIDTTSNECTITFPSSASVGDTIELVDYARTWGTNKIIIDSNGLNYQGEDDTFTVEYDTSGQGLRVVYSGATKGWIPTSDEVSEDKPLGIPYNIATLSIAGGGGGGNRHAGGGGAGGMLATSSTSLLSTSVYTITVGAGGAGGVYDGSSYNGSNSSIIGDGVSLTAIGGGSGGRYLSVAGGSGGSGGGGGSNSVGGAGTSGQGNAGANGGGQIGPEYGGAGGGGAGSAGSNGSSSAGGNGGNGASSSITGSAITYAGGGGGSSFASLSNAGSGGSGGGGDGSNDGGTPQSGTAYLGGGGGGGTISSAVAGAGGSGVVILSIPTANYSGTTSGSPTVTTSGSNTILKYTGSGSYTA